MQIEIQSNQRMLDYGLKERLQEDWDYVFELPYESYSAKQIKATLEKLYGWPRGLLKDLEVTKFEDTVFIR